MDSRSAGSQARGPTRAGSPGLCEAAPTRPEQRRWTWRCPLLPPTLPTHSVEEHVASLTVKMLRARLKKEGRSTKGLKDQLADRLLATLRAKKKSIQKKNTMSRLRSGGP